MPLPTGGSNTGGSNNPISHGMPPHIPDMSGIQSDLRSTTAAMRDLLRFLERTYGRGGAGNTQQDASYSRRRNTEFDFSRTFRDADKEVSNLGLTIASTTKTIQRAIAETSARISDLQQDLISLSTSTDSSRNVQEAILKRQIAITEGQQTKLLRAQEKYKTAVDAAETSLASLSGTGKSVEAAIEEYQRQVKLEADLKKKAAEVEEARVKLQEAQTKGDTPQNIAMLNRELTKVTAEHSALFSSSISDIDSALAAIGKTISDAQTARDNEVKSINKTTESLTKINKDAFEQLQGIARNKDSIIRDLEHTSTLFTDRFESNLTEEQKFNAQIETSRKLLADVLEAARKQVETSTATIKALQDEQKSLSTRKSELEKQQSDLITKETDLREQEERENREREELIRKQQQGWTGMEDWEVEASKNRIKELIESRANIAAEKKTIADKKTEIEEELKTNEQETKENKANLAAQREVNKQATETVSNANEAIGRLDGVNATSEALHKTVTSLRDTMNPLKILGAIANNLKDYSMDYLVKSFTEGFDRVYRSVEQTRNTISAQLKLNQGDFTDMQEALNEEIQAAGLEGTVSMVDINDAITSIVSAGITDKDTAGKLAFYEAQLKAFNSEISLSNEEMLEAITAATTTGGMSLDEVLNSIVQQAMGSELAVREEYGNALALRGKATHMTAEEISMGVGRGLDAETIAKNIANEFNTEVGMLTAGIDASGLTQIYKDFYEKGFENLSTQQAALVNQLAREGVHIEDTDMSTFVQEALKMQQQILSDVPAEWAHTAASVYDMPYSKGQERLITKIDIDRLVETGERISESANTTYKESFASLQNAEYWSKTYEIEKRRENTMAKQAIDAEQYYKGDVLFHAVVDPLQNTILELANVVTSGFGSVIMAMHSTGTFGTGGGGVGGAIGSIGLGAVGGGGLGIASSVITGAYGVGRIISEAREVNEEGGSTLDKFYNFFTSPDALGAVGTAIGGAAAGPIGALATSTVFKFMGQMEGVVEDFFTSGLDDFAKSAEQERAEANQRLLDAADAMFDTSDNLLQEADAMRDNIKHQKEIFANYGRDEKIQFIANQKLTDENGKNITAETLKNTDDKEIQTLFRRAIDTWESIQQKEIDEREKAAKAASDFEGEFQSLTQSNFVGEFTEADYREMFEGMSQESAIDAIDAMLDKQIAMMSESDLEKKRLEIGEDATIEEAKERIKDEFIESYGSNAEQAYVDLSVETQRQQAMYDAYHSEAGQEQLSDFQSYAKEHKMDTDNMEEVVRAYYQDYIDMGYDVNQEFIDMQAENITKLQEESMNFDTLQETFNKQMADLLEENKGLKNATAQDVIDAYNDKYKTSFTVNQLAGGIETIDGGSRYRATRFNDDSLYHLRTETDSGRSTYRSILDSATNMVDLDTVPQKSIGMYYVPYDDYLVRLHKGERVLTAEEAAEYNNLELQAPSITETVVDSISEMYNDMSNSENTVSTDLGDVLSESISNSVSDIDTTTQKPIEIIGNESISDIYVNGQNRLIELVSGIAESMGIVTDSYTDLNADRGSNELKDIRESITEVSSDTANIDFESAVEAMHDFHNPVTLDISDSDIADAIKNNNKTDIVDTQNTIKEYFRQHDVTEYDMQSLMQTVDATSLDNMTIADILDRQFATIEPDIIDESSEVSEIPNEISFDSITGAVDSQTERLIEKLDTMISIISNLSTVGFVRGTNNGVSRTFSRNNQRMQNVTRMNSNFTEINTI